MPANALKLSDPRKNIEKLVFDLEKPGYISSAWLRALLSAQKAMNKQGRMIVRGANETVTEAFEVTNFADKITFE